MEQNSQVHNDTRKEKLYGQLQEEYGRITYTYTCHLKAAESLKKRNSKVKWAQIILSAVSTGGFLGILISNEQILLWIGGLCSTALLVFTSYLKDKDFVTEQKKHLTAASELWILREKYLSLLTDLEWLEETEIVKKRDRLIEETSTIYKTAPPTDIASYTATQNDLKNNEAQFFTQEELNQMLPIHLRKEIDGSSNSEGV